VTDAFDLLGMNKIEWNKFKHFDTVMIGENKYEWRAPRK
jgi:hypothetical protein